MENQGNSSNQSRFLIAAVLSMAILFGWQYFFAPKPPPVDNANSNTAANTAANANTASPVPTPAPAPLPETAAATTPDTTPNRSITIKSPLYEVKLDSKGALATSWIIVKNKSPRADFPVYADGSHEGEQKPLQLISDEALKRSPREIPFRLATDDQGLTTLLNDRNYAVSVPEETITLADGAEKQIDFTLTDASGVEVKKSFLFRANSYVADVAVTVKRGGQTIPNTKLVIGASIGDHAINNHNFYHIESETVAAVNGDIKRHQGNYTFTYDANGQASLSDAGTVDWAGVGDAYFAMTAIPAAPAQGVEYKASKYDVQTKPFFESIFQWILRNAKTSETRHLVTVYLPIPADGSVTKVFTGTKDYFLLAELSKNSASQLGREVEITNLINFSNYWWLRWLTKPLSIPIVYSLNFFNGLTNNYGVAIIVFTFLFYSLLFPLRWSQSRSFKKASGNAPKMKAIQDQIKELQKKGVPNDDPRMRQLQMDQLKMTKDALPIGGCLPMLLQFPLLIAFYTAITIAVDVRQSTFIWLPDLSAADPWHLLEFAFAFSMILSMKFTPQAAVVTPEQAMQQKMMTYLMPAMMLWVMWAAPSGLLLYWFFGNIVSFGQQMLINRMNKPNTPPGMEIVDSVPKGAKKVKPKLSTT
ncbi:MAG TPA: membrane protein insertase YidC [Pyrinomonadaceae bacterium]|mgnify:FL=1|nr:membrane protein insertase YidC [Pyrinomonadaceae bacterium]